MLRTVSDEADPPPNGKTPFDSLEMSISSLDCMFWDDLIDRDKLPGEANK